MADINLQHIHSDHKGFYFQHRLQWEYSEIYRLKYSLADTLILYQRPTCEWVKPTLGGLLLLQYLWENHSLYSKSPVWLVKGFGVSTLNACGFQFRALTSVQIVLWQPQNNFPAGETWYVEVEPSDGWFHAARVINQSQLAMSHGKSKHFLLYNNVQQWVSSCHV